MVRVVETLILEVERLYAQCAISNEVCFGTKPRFEIEHDLLAARRLVRMIQDVAVQRIPNSLRYPATWWDALKLRWFPAWALGRWPAQYAQYDAMVLYPEIALPEKMHFMRVYRVDLGPLSATA